MRGRYLALMAPALVVLACRTSQSRSSLIVRGVASDVDTRGYRRLRARSDFPSVHLPIDVLLLGVEGRRQDCLRSTEKTAQASVEPVCARLNTRPAPRRRSPIRSRCSPARERPWWPPPPSRPTRTPQC